MKMNSVAAIVRKWRPWVVNLALLAWISFRCFRFATMEMKVWENDPTLLQLATQILNFLHVTTTNLLLWACEKSGSSRMPALILPTLAFSCQLLQDYMAILAVFGICRVLYVMYHHLSFSDFKHELQDSAFEFAKESLESVQKMLAKETAKMIPDMRESLGKPAYDNNKLLALPDHGRNRDELLRHLTAISKNEHETSWKTGKISGTVYTSEQQHLDFMNQVYGLYSIANTLHPGIWPRLNQCEAELVSMTSDIMHGTGIGCTTSGGTESIMLAIKAHWQHYGKRRGIAFPELICGSTAHAAVDKACEVFGIRKVMIDCNDGKLFTLNPKLVQRHITSNTIMVYASAPNYPQGTIDPIEDLGKIAKKYDIGLHVDACLGGFVLPFVVPDGASNNSFPKFDFQVPGVTSMSADTHKFGYAPKGTSIVLYRENALRHAQYFCYAQWTGGIYATPTFAGSRPSGLVACAWAALVTIGKEGYQQRTQEILDASRRIAIGINDKIPELKLLGQQRPSMVVCFASDVVDVYRVADAMKNRGWSLNSLQNPSSVHVCVTLALAPRAKIFLKDLEESVAEVRKEGRSNSQKGTAGMYGMAGSLPEGPVNDFLKVFIDLMLTA